MLALAALIKDAAAGPRSTTPKGPARESPPSVEVATDTGSSCGTGEGWSQNRGQCEPVHFRAGRSTAWSSWGACTA
jgi:hypothetical protein